MPSVIKKILASLVTVTLLTSWMAPLTRAENADNTSTSVVSEDASPAPIVSDAVRNAYLMIKLRQYMEQAERNYSSLQTKIDNTRGEIEDNRYEIGTLEGDVENLDSLIIDTQSKIKSVKSQISQKEQDIEKSLETLEFSEIQINEQKNALGSYLRLLYFEKNSTSSNNLETNFLKLFLHNGTISKTLQNASFLSVLEKQASNLINGLQSLERDQKKENYDLTLKRNQLDELENQLEAEYRNLTAQMEGKQNLLKDVENQDDIYRELFASYKVAQDAILEEINLFETNITALEDRLADYRTAITEEELAQIDQIRTDSSGDHSISEAANFLDLDWPVSPEMGLTAYFEDQLYVERFGVAHHAIDVRIPHGSIIYAPSDAVVYKVFDAAKLDGEKAKLGYGYIILAHRMGTMTLYGHISGALVNEGDFVKRGQMIGLTGGTPGTPGAGVRTTGAHLHFEVIQDGVRVDPLEYLPLNEVPSDYLLPQYVTLLEAQIKQELIDLQAEQEAAAHQDDPISSEETSEWDARDEGALIQQTIDNSFVNDLPSDIQTNFWNNSN